MENILDSNVLFGFWPKRRVRADLNSVKNLAIKHGITKMMITSMKGIFYNYSLGNQETVVACNADDSLIPVMTLNPCQYLGIDDEIGKCQSNRKKLFRFFPEYQNWSYSYAPFQRILTQLEPNHPVIILPARVGGHENNGIISEIGNLATKFPKVIFMITGVYYGNLAEAIVVAQEHPNVILETHLMNSPEGIQILVEHVGDDRLVFGSGMPLNYVSSAMLSVVNGAISDQSKAMILYQNALRLVEGTK
jgi:predicted TIM-barrel fold metal-dependent hydrolase